MSAIRGLAAALTLALAFAAGGAMAQDAPNEQVRVAREVIELSGVAGQMKNIVPIFLDEGKRTFVRTEPGLAKDLDESIKVLLPEFEKRRDQLMLEIAGVYAERFSLQELNDMKAFYSSDTGKKLVKIQPSVLQASYEKTNAWSRQMSQDVITRLREEMKKRGHDI